MISKKGQPIIVSIPHTGTRFLKERLNVEDNLHTTVAWESMLRELEGRPIIAPLRHPEDVWKSTYRRWLDPHNPQNVARFYLAWYMMHSLTLVREVDFIPVDLQKDERITNWEKVTGELDRDNKDRPDISLRHLFTLPFVAKYYKER